MQSRKKGWEVLKSKGEIQKLLKEGKKLRNNSRFQIYYRKNSEDKLRIVVFISKKLFKRAVDRNRARRLIKEIFKKQVEKLRGLDIIFTVIDLKREDLKLSIVGQNLLPYIQKLYETNKIFT